MKKNALYAGLLSLLSLGACNGTARDIDIVANHTSAYRIVIPADASKQEQHAANVLQDYVRRVSGAQLPIVSEKDAGKDPGIYIGHTNRGDAIHPKKLSAEGYLLTTSGNDIIVCGGSGKGVVYGVYDIITTYLHCDKLAGEPASVPTADHISIPGALNREHVQPMMYREVYYPSSHDPEYLEWHQLHQFEDLWGLWGHSYNKLVPAQTYFKTHPEYYAQVTGVRQPTQLCLSNEEVFKIAVAGLKARMAQNPDALYWSVSPNDDIGYCECDKCSAIDKQEGSPSGSLIRFVNRIAAAFPDKTFTTLAYGYTHRAPQTKPAKNVYIMLSDIDAYRDKPLAEEGSAATFRNDLKAWGTLTPNIFMWDYVTQFTNYLAPFPNFQTLQLNMQYLKENGVKGMFVQGSGDTYGEWAELRSYLLAHLLEDDKADVKKLTSDFLSDYYGKAAPLLLQYLDLLQSKAQASHRKLDIYGNPINEWNSYLTPELLDQYSTLFDKAEAAVEGNEKMTARMMRARLPLEYTVLKQARFYGIEKFGIFVKNDNGDWTVKPNLQKKISAFVANCNKAGVTELSEGGLKPDQYQAEWDDIIKQGVTNTKALGAQVSLQYPFAADYPAKGAQTLTDGNPGYTDFSYNWLCFYGTPMVATMDMGAAKAVAAIKMHFLDDPRHWIFLPPTVKVEVSADGTAYSTVATLTSPPADEHYEKTVKQFVAAISGKPRPVRFIRITAANPASLPAWRARDNKKPMIACDEIFVQ